MCPGVDDGDEVNPNTTYNMKHKISQPISVVL